MYLKHNIVHTFLDRKLVMSWLYIRYGHSEVYLFRSQIFFQEISISQKKKSFQSNVYIPGLFPLIFDGWVIFKAITFENVNITAL